MVRNWLRRFGFHLALALGVAVLVGATPPPVEAPAFGTVVPSYLAASLKIASAAAPVAASAPIASADLCYRCYPNTAIDPVTQEETRIHHTGSWWVFWWQNGGVTCAPSDCHWQDVEGECSPHHYSCDEQSCGGGDDLLGEECACEDPEECCEDPEECEDQLTAEAPGGRLSGTARLLAAIEAEDEAVLGTFINSPRGRVFLNAERGAIQVSSCPGVVAAHLPISKDLVRRLL